MVPITDSENEGPASPKMAKGEKRPSSGVTSDGGVTLGTAKCNPC